MPNVLRDGHQASWFESVEAGEDDSAGSAAFAFGSRFDWDLTKRIELLVEYRGQFTSREVGETTHHFVTTFEFELTKHFDLDVSLTWDRVSSPKPDENGNIPKPDDARLVFGFGLDF